MTPLRQLSPLLDAYLTALEQPRIPFNIPGHKGRAGDLDVGLGRLLEGDVPLFGGVEDMGLSGGLLIAAERRAASAYGAGWARFSVGGTSHTNMAACLAVRSLGGRMVAARNLHKSGLLGMVLADLRPTWVAPRVDPDWGLPLGLDPAEVEAALAGSGASSVLLTEPSYVGTLGDIAGIAEVAHRVGAAVVVDQAWSAHFGFAGSVPPHALTQGADVVTSSTHKTLAGYSQASLIAARLDRLDPGTLDAAFEVQHTTSPAGSILASIDASIALLLDRGEDLIDRLVERLDRLRTRLRESVPGLELADTTTLGAGRVDPVKLVLLLGGTGALGGRVAAELARGGTVVEYAADEVIIPIVTVFDDADALDRLGARLIAAIAAVRGPVGPQRRPDPVWGLMGDAAVPPREAFFAGHRSIPLAESIGEISQELAAVYPPGVAVLVPGEVITEPVVEALASARWDGRRVAYLHDPTLETVRVLR